MRKQLVFLFFVISLTNSVIAQCPLGVGITASPIGIVCKGTPVDYVATPSAGSISPQYVWVVNGDTVGNSASISNTTPGDVDVYMTSSNCPDTAFNLVEHQIILYNVDYDVVQEECGKTQADVQINDVSSFGGASPYTYDFIGSEGSLGQQSFYSDLSVGTYFIYVADDNGCIDTASIVVSTLECPELGVTAAITPNGDGYNDVWEIVNIEFYPENEVFIFDRWGQRVYHKKGYTNVDGWKAEYVGLDMPVSSYFYILEVTLKEGETSIFKGPISVFR